MFSGFAIQTLPVIKMACAIIWIAIVTMIAREHKKLEPAADLARHVQI